VKNKKKRSENERKALKELESTMLQPITVHIDREINRETITSGVINSKTHCV